MNEKLYIPKKLKVGFNYRNDTYSNKLGYVIYYDDKGKLRKETSWNNWIEKEGDTHTYHDGKKYREMRISADYNPYDFENTPMSGFVLNKNTGGKSSYNWDDRISRVRVYDPRGFEIEISIPNLLFILQECISSKGKGLEGEFVYSWSGKELVLLPVCSTEYKESSNFTELQSKRVYAKDMKEGCVYTFKDGEQCIYLGRHLTKLSNNIYISGYGGTEKMHIFYNISEDTYRMEKGFSKIALRVTLEEDYNYAEYLEKFLKSKFVSEISNIIFNDKIDISTFDDDISYYMESDNVLYEIYLYMNRGAYAILYNNNIEVRNGLLYNEVNYYCDSFYNKTTGEFERGTDYFGDVEKSYLFEIEELCEMKLYQSCNIELKSGKVLNLDDY